MSLPPQRELQREERLVEIGRLDRIGYSAISIAAAVGCNKSVVYDALAEIKKRHIKEMVLDREALVARKLAEYRDLRLACWEAYEKSKADAEREVTTDALRVTADKVDSAANKGGKAGKGGRKVKQQTRAKNNAEMVRLKTVKTRQGRLPGVEYLRLISDTYKAERELLGLDEATKLDVKAQVVNWDVFHVALPKEDVIEQRIQDELDRTPRELLNGHTDSSLDNQEG